MPYWEVLGAVTVGLGTMNIYWIVRGKGSIVNYFAVGFLIALGIATMF